jgi:hypothetical protein
MIASRQIAFGGSKRKPYDAEIEYLESTGTQWIDLGIIISPDVDFEFTGSIVSDMANGCIFGETNDFAWRVNNPGYSLVTTSGGVIYLRYGDSTAAIIGYTSIGLGNTLTVSLVGSTFKVDGQSVATVDRISNFSKTVSTMGIFKRNYINYSIDTYSAVRINGLKFGNLHDGALVRDLIPVRKGNVGYMYDRVSGQLFGNQGTGEFVLGSDLIDYTAKDYIQDGLVALVDGIENAGWGEHTDELKYVNLVTGEQFSFENSNNVLWGSDCLKILESGNRASGLRTGISFRASKLGVSTNAKNYTIECAIRAYDAEYPLISFDGGFGRTYGTASADNFQGVVTSAYLSDTDTHQWGVNGDIRSKTNSGVKQENFNGFYWNNREAYADSMFRFGFTYNYVCKSDLHCARVYNRVLTVEELAYNENIDKQRFGL